VALATSAARAALRWQSIQDPGVGGWVTSIKVSPHDPQRVLAGGDLFGIALSTNGGLTWLDTFGLRGSYDVEEFTWHPTDARVVWAGVMGGPHVSTNGGLNWTKQRAGFPPYQFGKFVAPVQKLLFDPANASRLLAFIGNHREIGTTSGVAERTHRGNVYASVNAGQSWSLLATIATNQDVYTAAFLPADPAVVLAATGAGLFRSANRGANWARITNGLPDGRARWLAVTPAAPNQVWAALGGRGVFKSTDGGLSFTAASGGLPLASGNSYEVITAAPSDAAILYCANANLPNRHLYRSTDGGATWSDALNFGSTAYPFYHDFHCLDIDPADARRVFGGTASTVWRATNGVEFADVSAVRVASGIYRGTGFSGQFNQDFRFNPWNTNEAAMCALDSGKWLTRDSFATWRHGGAGRGRGLDDWFGMPDFAFSRIPGVWWALQGQFDANGRIYRSSNFGTNWSALAQPPGVSGVPVSIVAHPDDRTQAWVLWSGEIFWTTNRGAAWTRVATNVTDARVLEADWRNPVQPAFLVGAEAGVFRTTNGVDFSKLPGVGGPQRVSRVKRDPASAGRLYALNPAFADVNNNDAGLWRWDTGVWTKLLNENTGPVRHLSDVDIDPTDNTRLLLATDVDPFFNDTQETGVWLSEDGGGSWRQENDGLPMLRVNILRFAPDGSGRVIAGLNGRGFYVAQMPPPPARLRLVPTGALWRYHDGQIDLGAAWRALAYDDSGWSNGVAPLGFGDGDEATVIRRLIGATPITTAYFRHTFTVADPRDIARLEVRLLRDDGGAVYLNGVEIFRSNLPQGQVRYDTQAQTSVGTGPEEGIIFFATNAPVSLLIPGTNLLAAEIHQHAPLSSSDLSFDCEMLAEPAPPRLRWQHAGGVLGLEWSLSSGGILETAPTMAPPADWQPWAGPLTTNGPWVSAPVSPTNPRGFFRLRRHD
jgi:photosystem II stability/assembly factor-like uncharacterized protein